MLTTMIRNAPTAVKVALAPALAIGCLVVVGAIGWLANHSLGGKVQELRKGAGFKAEKIEALDKGLVKRLAEFEKTAASALQDSDLSPEERTRFEAVSAEAPKYAKNVKEALDIKSGMMSNAAGYMPMMDASLDKIRADLHAVVESESARAASTVAASQALTTRNSAAMGVGLLVAALATLGTGWMMLRLIVRPLGDASRTADAVAQGDLRQQTRG